ncbi:Osmotically-inducible protein Y precursor [compost metagenome]
MPSLKSLALASATLAVLSLGANPSYAQGDLPAQLQEARQEGSIWTALALNRTLSPFKIDVTVDNGTATLKGRVESQVDRDLAEQIAQGTAGITQVDNQLVIDETLADQPSEPQKIAQRFEDATLTATIKSKLLWNTQTEGLNIEVETRDGIVTLKGHAQSAEAKTLAGTLASNTAGVQEVNNLISFSSADASSAPPVQGALSDAWVSGKVKASLLYSRNLDGINIKVDSKEGMVRLSGVVVSTEEKALAIEVARNIRGVRGVDADLLKVAGKPTI